MRQVKVLLFVVLAVLVAVNAAMAREPIIMTVKLISGYAPGEFALKGEIFSQVEKIAKEIIKEDDNNRNGVELHIMITGTADATGKSAANDQLALARAEQVKAYLAHIFPNAKINCWSSGQDPNVRQVWVKYGFANTYSPIAKMGTDLILYTIMSFAVLACFYLLFLRIKLDIKIRRQAKQKENQSTLERPEGLNGASWITVNGYQVVVERQEGKFVSPFRSDSGGKIIRDDRRGLIESLKGCLKSVVFAEQKELLTKKGKIKIVAENTEVKQ